MGRKTQRIFKEVSNIREYMDVLQSHGDKVLYRYPVGTQYASMTYSEFHTQVLDTAAGFKALGLAGKRIAIIGETCPEWLEMFYATISSGAVAIPFDKELLVTEIKGFIEISKADAIFFSPKYAKKYTELKEAGALDSLEYIIPADLSEMEGVEDKRVVSFYDFIAGAEIETIMPSEIMRAKPRGEMCIMLFWNVLQEKLQKRATHGLTFRKNLQEKL